MGLSISHIIQSGPYSTLDGGLYRITHKESETVIGAFGQNQLVKCVPETTNNQQLWFVEKDGDGYRFKHHQLGTYSGIDSLQDAACASSNPMKWMIYAVEKDNTFVLQAPGYFGVLERHLKPDGRDLIDICPEDNAERMIRFRGWRLERVGPEDSNHDTANMEALREEISKQKQELLDTYRDLSNCQRSLIQQELTIKNMTQEIETLKNELRQYREAGDEKTDAPRPRNMA